MKEIAEIIDGRQRYALPDVAKKSPAAFVEDVWPVFREMIEELSNEKDDARRIYLSDLAHWTGQKRDKLVKEKYSLVTIFAEIMLVFASANAERFKQFVAENANSQSLFIHRLLCWGLASIAHEIPEVALEYLCGDERRLIIGSVYDPHSESIALIQALGPVINNDALMKLEQSIRDWHLYLTDEILAEEEKRSVWQREHRLRLLSAIPESARSKNLDDFIKVEAQALPGFDREQMSEPEVFMDKSPMSVEQMSTGSVEEIQAMLRGTRRRVRRSP